MSIVVFKNLFLVYPGGVDVAFFVDVHYVTWPPPIVLILLKKHTTGFVPVIQIDGWIGVVILHWNWHFVIDIVEIDSNVGFYAAQIDMIGVVVRDGFSDGGLFGI